MKSRRLHSFWFNGAEGAILYSTPTNLSYFYSFGALSGLALAIQIVSGLFLVFCYVPSIQLAFEIGQFISRDVLFGWLLRSLHANGASLFFIVVYCHIIRNLFLSSFAYPRSIAWQLGVVLFLLLILTAFLGYVLPWGQMSYWAATVISTLLSTIPFVGEQLLIYLWGGIVLDQCTLTRIFGLHYLLPFVILVLSGAHIAVLHRTGSSNPLSLQGGDTIPFHPYFTWKDSVIVLYALSFLFVVIGFAPDIFGHSDNFIPANPAVTPLHIVPEWYFLPFYGILRSVPSKVGGVLLLAGAISVLFFLPLIARNQLIQSGRFRPFFKCALAAFLSAFILLGWSGGQPIEEPFYTICQLTTLSYFGFFIVILPICRVGEFATIEVRGWLRQQKDRWDRVASWVLKEDLERLYEELRLIDEFLGVEPVEEQPLNVALRRSVPYSERLCAPFRSVVIKNIKGNVYEIQATFK